VTPDESDLGQVLAEVRRFGRAELSAARFEELGEIPKGVLARGAELGLFGLALPVGHGGLGFDLRSTGEVVAELARHDRSFATTIGLHNGLGTRPLIEHGDEHVAERWLPRLASGQTIAAFAATEASAGSDLTAVRTVATPEGDMLRVDGEKHYVTNGGFAGLFTALVRTPHLGRRARSMVLIPRETEGVSIGPEEHKLGLNASSTVSVFFDGAQVDGDHLLGEGAGVAEGALEWGRSLMSYGCLGTARAALDASIEHVQARKQFGRPLSRFGAVQAHLGHMARTVFAMESILAALGDAKDKRRLSVAAKVFCSEGAFDVCDRAVQLHGALGFIEDSGVPRLLRDCRVTRIFEGANDVLLVRSGALHYAGGPAAAAPRLHDVRDSPWESAREALDAELEHARQLHRNRGVRDQWLCTGLARAELRLLVASACLRRPPQASMLARQTAHSLIEIALEPLSNITEHRERDESIVALLLEQSDDSTSMEAFA